MTLAQKLDRLINESGWSISEVARRIGRDANLPVLRWLGRTGTGREPSPDPSVSQRKDGTKRRERESAPDRHDLIALSDLFGVDIRWLIDDDLEWDDKLKADNPALARIRRLPMEDQIDMIAWHASRQSGKKNGPVPTGGN